MSFKSPSTRIWRFLIAVGILALAGLAIADIGSGFTYQGELRLQGAPTDGEYDFRFRLYGAESGGDPIGSELERPAVRVDDGLFTVLLDFDPAAFSGQARWLEIDVRESATASYQTLAPRTLLAAVPYAWSAALALPGSVGPVSIQDGAVGALSIDAAEVQRRVSGACPAGTFLRRVNEDGSVECLSPGPGGGEPAWLLGGNAGTDATQDYIGTSDDQPLVLRANAQPLLRIAAVPIPGSDEFTANIVMGSADNVVRSGVRGAVIGGGGVPPSSPDSIFNPNVVSDHFGTVGGGHANLAGNDDGSPNSATWATVGGGVDNQARGRSATVAGGEINIVQGAFGTVGGGQKNFATETGATVAGGQENRAAGITSTVAGGTLNSATGLDSTVGGGGFNTASGRGSVVAGGELNCAGATYSWAGGRRAKVRPGLLSGAVGEACAGVPQAGSGGDQGTFIWADSQNTNFQSTGPNQFLVRAQGGIFLGTGGPVNFPANSFLGTSTGAFLSDGGVWTNSSSRALKTDFINVDAGDILARLLSLPLTTWRYQAGSEQVRHLGPMAEEFHAAFRLGGDDAAISTVDVSGVALAAIQGLNQRLEAENGALRRQNADQDAAIAELRAELEELRRLVLQPQAQSR